MAPKVSKKKSDDYSYEVSRYTPRIKTIIQDSAAGILDPSAFSSVKATGGALNASSTSSSAKAAPVSLRHKATTTSSSSTPNSASAAPSRSVIVFVIGGVTHSEIRSAYEVADSTKREIYIGIRDQFLIFFLIYVSCRRNTNFDSSFIY